MLLLSLFAVDCIWDFQTTSVDESTRYEKLVIVGFLSIFSLVLFIIYSICSLILRKNIPVSVQGKTLLPFIAMLLCTIYSTHLGLPW